MRRIYIYTENHGHSAGITDLVTMIRNGARDCGYDAVISDVLVPGECNIMVELFHNERVQRYVREKWTPGTRYIYVCTEYLSSHGFNHDLVKGDTHYSNQSYWESRYQGLLSIADLASDLWVLAESQVAAYQCAFPENRVSWLRHGWVSDMATVRHRTEREKDIDFFFSGSLTPSRLAVLRELQRHHTVAFSPQSGGDYLRMDLLARSKVCLAMPLSPANALPSVSRLHFHVQNANFVLQQAYPATCELDPYVLHAPADEFLDWARAALSVDNRREIAEAARARFRAEMPVTRWLAQMLDAPPSRAPGLSGVHPPARREPAALRVVH